MEALLKAIFKLTSMTAPVEEGEYELRQENAYDCGNSNDSFDSGLSLGERIAMDEVRDLFITHGLHDQFQGN